MARFKHTPDVLYNLIEGPKLPERFKALQDMGGAEGLAKALCTDLRKGLSKAEVSEERKKRSALRCPLSIVSALNFALPCGIGS